MADALRHGSIELNKLSQAVEQSPASIVITDLQGTIEYVNYSFIAATGYEKHEAIGQNPRMLKSGKTPSGVHEEMWTTIMRGEVWQGELINQRKNGSEYVEQAIVAPIRNSLGDTTHYLAIKQDITRQRATAARIEYLLHHDPLTGLPNRALLEERLSSILNILRRQKQHAIFILVDLDRFKTINDARGMGTGDALIKAAGERLRQTLRDDDTVARLGADEFALLITDINHDARNSIQQAQVISEKVHHAFEQPLRVEAEDFALTLSMGVTIFPEARNETAADIHLRADTALHQAKAAGGGKTAFFEADMGQAATQRYQIERELREAIPAGELRLHLQSQVDAKGRIVGAEALVRWQHPTRGMIQPGQFVPIAEESHLIVELGAWVLGEACRLLADEHVAGRQFRLSVNVSPRQFREAGFVAWLKELLITTGADPVHLTLEVTEGIMLDNIEETIGRMHTLAALGIHFSIDDFGTGYSSLAYLKRLPINELKIDKSFVQDAPTDSNDAILVETMMSLSQHMGFSVVAEGVETDAQADFLNTRGKVVHQGYLYSMPEPAEAWLQRWREQLP